MAVTLGYWKIRGLAQSIKFLFEYTGMEYNEKHYERGPPPELNGSCWFDEKYKLGLDFPNLPYYFEGDIKMSQTHAIIKHIARMHNLVGENETENIRIDMTEHEALDIRTNWWPFVYKSKEDFENSKEDYKKTILQKFSNFSKFLGDYNWFAGDRITYVDFILYEIFDIHKLLFPDCLDDFKNLKKFQERFESLEPIKNYMNSDRFMKYPLNGPMAAFGGKHT